MPSEGSKLAQGSRLETGPAVAATPVRRQEQMAGLGPEEGLESARA